MTPSSVRIVIGQSDLQQISPGAIILSVQVTHAINDHSTCEIRLRQTRDRPFDLTKFYFKQIDIFATVAPGLEIPLYGGFIDSRVRQRHDTSGAVELVVSTRGDTALMEESHLQTFLGVSFETKIKTFTDRVGTLEPAIVVDNQDAVQFCNGFYQLGETDWQHLLAEASSLGVMLFPDGDKLFAIDHFQPSPTTLRFSDEGGLLAFEVRAAFQPALWRATFYDREKFLSDTVNDVKDDVKRFGSAAALCDQVVADNTLGAPNAARPEVLALSKEVVEQVLKADSRRAIANAVRGVGESREGALLIGRTVTIEGADEIAGTWGVIRVVHKFSPTTGYINEFECTPFDSPLCMPAVPFPRVTAPLHGRVTSAPSKDLIRVQFPWEKGDESLFMRWLTPMAGADRGFCFPPEVGDEVLVQFANGDSTSDPFIAAAVWNGQERPPLEDVFGKEVENNDIKRLVTKSGNRLVMDDKNGKETIVVATPKHVRVSLFDGGSTLLLHSDGDIHLNAGGTVHMKCKQFLREVG